LVGKPIIGTLISDMRVITHIKCDIAHIMLGVTHEREHDALGS
jgi:hypothetical protein